MVDGVTLEIIFSEDLASVTGLTNTAFTVKKTPDGGSETEQMLSGTPTVSDRTVTLTLLDAVIASDGGTVKVSYTSPSEAGAKLRDASDNAVANFTDQKVLNVNGGICPRTKSVQDGLLAIFPPGSITCDNVSNTLLLGYRGSVHVQIIVTEPDELQSGDLNGLSNLATLTITGSATLLPEDLFGELGSLKNLYLLNLPLLNLQGDLFSGLTNLEDIVISSNTLQSIPEDLFEGLINLGAITLNTRNLPTLDEDLFNGLINLGTLFLSSNGLTTLGEDLFDGLTNLSTVSLFLSSLTSYPEDLFDGLTNLGTLTLSNVNVPSLPEELFDGLTNLTSLEISPHRLETLHENLFDGITGAISVFVPAIIFPGFCVPNKILELTNVTFTPPERTVVNCSDITITLSTDPTSIGEGDGPSQVPVFATINNPLSFWVSVTVSLGGGTATSETDFAPVSDITLYIPANTRIGRATFTVTPNSDILDESNETIMVSGISFMENVTVTGTSIEIIDDDDSPTATLSLSSNSIGEGESTTVSAQLSSPSGEETTFTISVEPTSPATESDYVLSDQTLTIAAGEASSAETVTITAAVNDVDAPDKTFQVMGEATNSVPVSGPENVELTITDDDETPTVMLRLSSNSITENGGTTEVTATLSHPSSEQTTITFSESPGLDIDYTLSGTALTIDAGETTSDPVTISAVNNDADTPDKTTQIQGTAENTQGITGPEDVEFTITDDDDPPTVMLRLSSNSITENGGTTEVTATLSHPSSEQTTITLSESPGPDIDYMLSGITLMIPAEATTSTEMVTITAEDNVVDAPDKTVTVGGVAENTQGIIQPEAIELTITDDEDTPTVMLSLSSSSISENEGSTEVTATLNHPSSEEIIITVSVSPIGQATDEGYDLGDDQTLTIAAGEKASTGTVIITAVDNMVDAPDRTVQVQGTPSNLEAVTGPEALELIITDDDTEPTVTLLLSPVSIREGGESTSLSAMLSNPSSEVTTVDVMISPDDPATASDYMLIGTTLTIDAGEMESTNPLTITSVDNQVDAPDKTVQVRGTASNDQGIINPMDVELTITDNDEAPRATLLLSSSLIGEDGETTTVTATLNRPSSEETTIDVTVLPDAPATSSDYMLSGNTTLTFEAGATVSSGMVTITSVTNDVDAPDKTVQVQGAATNMQGVTGPEDVELTITDGTAPPSVTLALSSPSITENEGTSTVTATLNRTSSEPTTVMVNVLPVGLASRSDYTLIGNTLTIAMGATTSTGDVTIRAVDNLVDAPDKTVQVQGSAMNTQGITNPAKVELMILDDETAPTVTLLLSMASIDENGGESTVTAMLDRASSEPTTVIVNIQPDTPATESDYTLTGSVLTIDAGATVSRGLVTITAEDNQVDAPVKTIQVRGTATNTQGITNPADVELTITDDEDAPTLTLALSSSSISEDGESTTVTATLSHPSSAVTTILIVVLPDEPAKETDYTFGGNQRLTIAAGQTSSTGLVMITAVNNVVNAPDKIVQVQGTATNSQSAIDPANLELTITDDDESPTVTLILEPPSIPENSGVTTVMASLNHPSSEVTTIEISAFPIAPATVSDFALSGNQNLSIAPGETASTELVMITAVDNEVDAPDRAVQVRGQATNTLGVTSPENMELLILDEEDTPTVTLVLSPVSIPENAGFTTVTATIDRPSSEVTTIEISTVPDEPATELDYTQDGSTLTIAAGETNSTGDVMITAIDNDLNSPSRTIQVQGIAINGQGITDPSNAELTILDDDLTPTVTLLLSNGTIDENGGQTTVTATLSRPSGEETTIEVTVLPDAPATEADYVQSGSTLTIAEGETESQGLVTIMALNNNIDAPSKSVQVRGVVTSPQETTLPVIVPLMITDDDVAPTVTLLLDPPRIVENRDVTTVTATLSHPSSAMTTIVVSALPVSPAQTSDLMVSQNTILTIAAGKTESEGDITITAVNNDVFERDREIELQGVASNSQGIVNPESAILTIADDDEQPSAVTLAIMPTSISERGGSTTVTATIEPPSNAVTTILVSALPDPQTSESDYMFNPNTTLTIAEGATESTGIVTITAVDNDENSPDKTIQIQGIALNPRGVTSPPEVELTITDDESPPTVMLMLDPSTIDENGGMTAVTATLNHSSAAASTIEISVMPDAPATESDYQLSSNSTLTIAAGDIESSGLVTITAQDNEFNDSDKTLKVRGTVTNALGINEPAEVELTIANDDEAPTVTLLLDASTIGENGGMTTVMAALDRVSSEVTTVTVSVSPELPTTEPDYLLSDNLLLTIEAGELTSMGLVTITAVDNDVDAPDKTLQVQGVTTNSSGVSGPESVELTITDDDEEPTVTLMLDSPTIPENGGTATVTATLDRMSSAVTMVEISVQPNTPAMDSDYQLSENQTLTIAAGTLESTGLVTVTAVDNEADEPDKTVQVLGTATNPQGVIIPAELVLTIANDDESFPEALDATVSIEEDTPYTFSLFDFGYSDPEGDPLASIRIERHPDVGMLTLNGTGFPDNTSVSSDQISAGAFVYTPIANAYGPAYTSFDFKVSDGASESPMAAALTIDITPINDVATGRPEIVGSMQIGQVLRVSVDDIQDVDGVLRAQAGESGYGFRFQWFRVNGTLSEPIQEGSTYAPEEIDAGTSLMVQVTFVDDSGFEERLESLPRQVRTTSRIRTAWMGRMGRTVADQVLRAMQCERRVQRLQRDEVQLAGQPLALSSLPNYVRLREIKPDQLSSLLGNSDPVYQLGHSLTRNRLLQGSSFQHRILDGSNVALWGQGTVSQIQGVDGALNLDGRVSSGIVGADWTSDKAGLGVLVAHSRSEGNYAIVNDEGELSSHLTGVYPNGCYALTPGITAWGVVGYGRGSMTVEEVSAPVGLWMVGGGVYGRLFTVEKQRLELGLRSDALLVQTSASGTEGLLRDQAQVTRLRLGVQGAMRGIRIGTASTIEPSAQLALRHDGGDAETGFGVDMQVGFILTESESGLNIEVYTRAVLTHQDSGLQERGLTRVVTWDRKPYTTEGFQVRVEHTIGEDALGGADRLLRAETIQPHYAVHHPGDLRMRAGYGVALFSEAVTLRPEVGVSGWGLPRRYEDGMEHRTWTGLPHRCTTFCWNNRTDTPERSLASPTSCTSSTQSTVLAERPSPMLYVPVIETLPLAIIKGELYT